MRVKPGPVRDRFRMAIMAIDKGSPLNKIPSGDMKVLALLLLLAEFFATFAVAKNIISDNLRGSAQQQDKQPQLDPNAIHVLVEYTNEDGKNVAKREALELSYESTRFKVLGMTIAAKSLKLLQDTDGIERVDLDCEVDAILSFVEEDHEEDVQEADTYVRCRRKLIEQVPWGIRAIQADQVEPGPFASDVKVCIIDSGYAFHSDLPGRDAVTGTHSSKYSDVAGNQWDQDDGRKHGTASAGVIAAIDNEIGVVGVLQNVNPNSFTLHISKGLDDYGRGSVSGVIEAIEGCIDAGSNVISMSLRVGRGFVRSFNNVLKSAYLDHDILLVAASGNDGNEALSFPASYGSVMSVSAVKKSSSDYTVADFSNFNKQVEITAPGVRIKTTSSGNDYKFRSGTSLATPYVAGVAALVRSYGRCSAQQVRRILLATAMDVETRGCDSETGHGLVQAKSAIDMLRKHGCRAADELDLLDARGMNNGTLCRENRNEDEQIIRINAGSSQDYVDLDGNVWSADAYYNTGRTHFTSARISNTDKPELYQSERFASQMTYQLPVGEGTFDVKLLFSEIYTGAFGVGKRVFRVLVQGQVVTDKIDIYKESGQGNRAYVSHTRGVVVRDGVLSIEFIGIRENAKISAIEIQKVDSAPSFQKQQTVLINTGGPDFRDKNGNIWVADTKYISGGNTHSTTERIANTDSPVLYQTERFGTKMEYKIPVLNGTFDVYFHFAEIYRGALGVAKRIQDVYIQGELEWESAGREGYRAYVVRKRRVMVTDGMLEIDLIAVKDNAKISAIEIRPVS